MRINVIHPKHLADQHLVAEYQEIKMLPKSLRRSLNAVKGFSWDKVPVSYTLNKGHGYFFYNKLDYIEMWLYSLIDEMKNRNFKTTSCSIDCSGFNNDFYSDYVPTKEAIEINLERI